MTVAQLSRQQRAELVRRYQARIDHAATTLGAAAAQAWDGLGSWDEADIEQLATRLAPTAKGTLAHAAAMTAGFVGLAASVPVAHITPIDAVDWAPAFRAYWKSLTNSGFEDALQAGSNTAEAVGFDAVQSAARDTAAQIDRKEPRITSWARVPDSNACDWCIEVSGGTYHSAESASFGHNRCGCSVVPA